MAEVTPIRPFELECSVEGAEAFAAAAFAAVEAFAAEVESSIKAGALPLSPRAVVVAVPSQALLEALREDGAFRVRCEWVA